MFHVGEQEKEYYVPYKNFSECFSTMFIREKFLPGKLTQFKVAKFILVLTNLH